MMDGGLFPSVDLQDLFQERYALETWAPGKSDRKHETLFIPSARLNGAIPTRRAGTPLPPRQFRPSMGILSHQERAVI